MLSKWLSMRFTHTAWDHDNGWCEKGGVESRYTGSQNAPGMCSPTACSSHLQPKWTIRALAKKYYNTLHETLLPPFPSPQHTHWALRKPTHNTRGRNWPAYEYRAPHYHTMCSVQTLRFPGMRRIIQFNECHLTDKEKERGFQWRELVRLIHPLSP